MNFWYVIFLVAVFFAMIIIPLGRRWYAGCGLALLGGILGGAGAWGMSWYYLTYLYVKPKPRNDSDWTGIGTALFCIVIVPAVGMILGSVLGVYSAYFLREWLPAEDAGGRERARD